MKRKNTLLGIALILVLTLVLCACDAGGSGKSGSTLNLDYEGEEDAAQEEEKQNGGSWFSDAFSFGKKDNSNSDNPDGSYVQGDDDSTAVGNNIQGGSNNGNNSNNGNTSQGNGSTQSGNATQGNQSGSSQSNRPGSNSSNGNSGNSQSGSNNGSNGSANNQGQGSQTTNKNTVTISIRCDTAVNNGMHLESKWTGIVPASGSIIPATTVEIEDGMTVFDVLAYVCNKFKVHMSYRGGTGSGCYVDGINNLYEFDGGRWSGWMYCVNKWYPNYGCGVYYVKAGDVIEWNYTCDLGLDLEGGDIFGAQEWKDTHE